MTKQQEEINYSTYYFCSVSSECVKALASFCAPQFAGFVKRSCRNLIPEM